MIYNFSEDLKKFNSMYRMQVAEKPTLQIPTDLFKRLKDLEQILLKELQEISIIQQKVNIHKQGLKYFVHGNVVSMFESGWDHNYIKLTPEEFDEQELDILTDLADWLGDIQVYCGSEMTKFGLPVNDVLEIIMESNFSKMGADGNPIYDEQGKLLKGPNYWKPETRIKELLFNMRK